MFIFHKTNIYHAYHIDLLRPFTAFHISKSHMATGSGLNIYREIEKSDKKSSSCERMEKMSQGIN